MYSVATAVSVWRQKTAVRQWRVRCGDHGIPFVRPELWVPQWTILSDVRRPLKCSGSLLWCSDSCFVIYMYMYFSISTLSLFRQERGVPTKEKKSGSQRGLPWDDLQKCPEVGWLQVVSGQPQHVY